MSDNGNLPAFPHGVGDVTWSDYAPRGLSKREWLAGTVAAGLATLGPDEVAAKAVQLADALLKRLGEGK